MPVSLRAIPKINWLWRLNESIEVANGTPMLEDNGSRFVELDDNRELYYNTETYKMKLRKED